MKTIDKMIYIYGASSILCALYKNLKDLTLEERKAKNKSCSELAMLNKEVFKIIMSGKDCDDEQMHEFKDFIDRNFEGFKSLSQELLNKTKK